MTREEAIEILKTDSCADCGVGAQSPCTCEFDGHCDIKSAYEDAKDYAASIEFVEEIAGNEVNDGNDNIFD